MLGQLQLDIERAKEADRNFHLGGRSFYFFDFDDNVAFLATPIILFHKESGAEKVISSGEFAEFQSQVGKSGPFIDYEIRWMGSNNSFRYFRDYEATELEKLGLKRQVFLEHLAEALALPDLQWKGPSWDCFYHASFNQRPVSVITARGHDPATIQAGISLFVQKGFLPAQPNYLSIFPVSHLPTRALLGDPQFEKSTAELKQAAIRASVEKAFQEYGYSPHHRFGMSDDDPRNLHLIAEEMRRLKTKYPEVSFFVIETQKGDFIKHEIRLDDTLSNKFLADPVEQIQLF